MSSPHREKVMEGFSLAPIPDREFLKKALKDFLVKESGGVSYYTLPPELNYLVSLPDDPVAVMPQEFTFLAAFDSQGLAGRISICPFPFIEGTWVREDLRKGRVGVTLLKELEARILGSGRTHAWALAADETPEVSSYLERCGYSKLPLTVWMKSLVKEGE